MKLPSLKRLFKRDFRPEYAEIVDAMSDIMNSNLEVVYEALNRKLTFTDNITSVIRELQVNTDQNGKITNPASFTLDNFFFIEGLIVVKVTNLTNSVGYPNGGVFASYDQAGKVITVNNITGLPANSRLLIKIITLN
jgi:hypothetical protein